MVAVAAEDEEVEGGVGVGVVLAYGDGKGIEKDVVLGKEEHVLLQGTVDVAEDTRIAVEYWLIVAAVGSKPWHWQMQLHNCGVVDP